jgi:hypothetical protein
LPGEKSQNEYPASKASRTTFTASRGLQAACPEH